MIRFRGEISNNAKKYIVNRQRKMSFFVAVVVDVIISVVYYGFIWRNNINEDWVPGAIALVLVIALVAMSLPPSKKSRELLYPSEIEISEDGIITSVRPKFKAVASIDDVTKVLDEGEWYQICVAPYEIGNYLCQKDLLVEGSIEEFEKIFNGKIVRKDG